MAWSTTPRDPSAGSAVAIGPTPGLDIWMTWTSIWKGSELVFPHTKVSAWVSPTLRHKPETVKAPQLGPTMEIPCFGEEWRSLRQTRPRTGGWTMDLGHSSLSRGLGPRSPDLGGLPGAPHVHRAHGRTEQQRQSDHSRFSDLINIK